MMNVVEQPRDSEPCQWVAAMRVGSLCSGFGGLEMAVEDLWPCARVVSHAETDPWASKVLEAHWPGVPNLGDITNVDWSVAGPVDVLTAGYPCQPFSTAGRREGENDDRHLWPQVLRAVRDLRPGLVLLENVAGHLSLGFGRVLGDLAEAGYDASWTCLRASDVGACHRRERVFIAAYPHGEGRQSGHGLPQPDRRDRPPRSAAADAERGSAQLRRGSRPVARQAGNVEGERHQRERGGDAAGCGDAAHPFGAYQPAVDRWAAVIGRPAPPGLDGSRLNARFVEWMQGLPEGWVTDVVPRRHALRILGNGVVPAQAATAYRSLLEFTVARSGDHEEAA